MNNKKIGEFIKQLRKEKGLTQKNLADKLNITDRAISRWERGIGCPDISLLEELSKILDISVLELLKGEKLENTENTNESDLIKAISFTKHNLITKFLNITNIISFSIVILICIYIVITNLKSIYIEKKKYYFYNESTYLASTEKLITEFDEKANLILNNQGNFSDEDYKTVKTYVNVLKTTLGNQNDLDYLKQENFSFRELVYFLINHQDYLFTYNLDNTDLYEILVKYNSSLTNNLIMYVNQVESFAEDAVSFKIYLYSPYSKDANLKNYQYEVNPYYIINSTYRKETGFLNDIIKAGEIK